MACSVHGGLLRKSNDFKETYVTSMTCEASCQNLGQFALLTQRVLGMDAQSDAPN